MSDRPVAIPIADMLERLDRIARYTSGFSREAFARDDKTVDAVVRSLEVIGEAARRLPEDFKRAHDEIPWRQIAGLRNRVVHAYFDVDVELVWRIVANELAGLRAAHVRLRGSGEAEA